MLCLHYAHIYIDEHKFYAGFPCVFEKWDEAKVLTAYPAARQDGPVDRQVPCLGTGSVTTRVPSGKRLHSYWKWWFIVDVPIKNGDFPELCKRLPEGNLYQVNHQRQCKERIAGKSEPGDIPTSQVMKLRQLRSWTKMVTWPTGHI